MIVVASTGVVGVILGISAVQDAWLGQRPDPMLTGFSLGAALTCVAWGAWSLAISVDGSASWRIGADAEQWTASELHALGRLWVVEHDVPFPEDGYFVDVDHVAVGPFGVLVVETKWTSDVIDLGARRLAKRVEDAVQRAQDNAGRVRGLLRRVADVEVIPLVVFWGRDVKGPEDVVRRVGEVRVVAGGQGDRWRQRLSSERVDPQTVARLAERLQGWTAEQEDKLIGADVGRWLRRATLLGRSSVAASGLIAALLAATRLSKDVDRSVVRVLRIGSGAIGVFLLLLPLVLALLALVCVYFARRLDPTLGWSRRLAPVAVWLVGFVALCLAAS
ncbi:MAG TPA: nuclease-related domain-containing protein [Acidimicrobiales bacterium]|nr:nuclease-related domain-containing protein [Acidimicrobiales bacterium]